MHTDSSFKIVKYNIKSAGICNLLGGKRKCIG
jgi:hypothetical protein